MATKKPVKKTTAKAPAKKSPTTKPKAKTTRASAPKIVRIAKRERMESFRLSRPQTPFLTIAITRQTLYWGIIAVSVLALGLWIITIQRKVNEIYDQIDATRAAMNQIVIPPTNKATK